MKRRVPGWQRSFAGNSNAGCFTSVFSPVHEDVTNKTLQMNCRLLFSTHVIFVCLAFSARADESGFAVTGYLPDYRVANVVTDRFSIITDLVYFGIQPPADGRLPASPVDASVLRKLKAIKVDANCKLLLCVGGWERSDGFPALAMSESARQRFVSSLLSYCRKNGFDGVDYDWEHPKNAQELTAYGRLLSETAMAFHERQLLVSVAQAGWQNLGKDAYAAVDRVHLMSYDHEFPQATFEKSTSDVDRLIGWGCPAEKIAMGLPFYGRNEANEARTYGELVGQNAIDPRIDNIDGFAFNGTATINRKVKFAKTRGLSGVMIWELGQDSARESVSLLRTIRRQLGASISRQRTGK